MTQQKENRILFISAALHDSGHPDDADLVLALLQESENRMTALLFMVALNLMLVFAKLWGA